MAFVIRRAKSLLSINNVIRRSYATKQQDPLVIVNPNDNIKLSESCVKRLEKICNDGSFLRITVEGGGCSGFSYKFELDNQQTDDDLSFGVANAKIVIDNISLNYCHGATVDYHNELIKSGFRIMGNPKAEQGCSCGSSFALKVE